MVEVMGGYGLNTILGLAGLERYIDQPPPDDLARQFDFAYIAAISQALEDVYGPRGGRGIALRIGRAMVANGLNHFGVLAGMRDPAFQALPLPKRLNLGVEALAAVFNKFTDQACKVQEDDDHYYFSVSPAPMTWGRAIDQPANHMLVGIIQGTLSWATQGKEFIVQEQPSTDEVTVFQISKRPIGGS